MMMLTVTIPIGSERLYVMGSGLMSAHGPRWLRSRVFG